MNATTTHPTGAFGRPQSTGLVILAACWLLGPVAEGHFLFLVPEPEGKTAAVILSETLSLDDDIDPAIVDTATLEAVDVGGIATPLVIERVEDRRIVRLPDWQRGLLCGSMTHGVMAHGPQPYLLVYHPRVILGYPFGPPAHGDAAEEAREAEAVILPAGHPGHLQFQLLARGRPVADAEMTVITPEGKSLVATTDAEGFTQAFTQAGRYGAWARVSVATGGEHEGEAYDEIRHYPTLVIDVPGGHRPADADSRELSQTTALTPLPVAASSLGVAACDGWVYVYGGHVAAVHTYHTKAVSGRFFRAAIESLVAGDGKAAWEELPAGPGMQGMNLAAHAGSIYRGGGMIPVNAPDEPAENFSTDLVARYDPVAGRWHSLPSLPEPRSSHDLAVVGDTLYVVGGWNMLGDEGEVWAEEMFALDLGGGSGEAAVWRRIEQPFVRRALITAVAGGRLYVIGGFTDEDEPSLRVDIYDPAAGRWSRGPDLPGGAINGFAAAACTNQDVIHASVADGSVFRLRQAATAWEPVAAVRPRIVHRAVPCGPEAMLLVGGAAGRDNLDLVERVPLPALAAEPGRGVRQARP